MLQFKAEYENFIERNGVGSNDKVASSIKSYVSYLNSVGRHLNITVSPKTLNNIHDIGVISSQLKGKISDKTIKNYDSAMKQYVEMVKEMNL